MEQLKPNRCQERGRRFFWAVVLVAVVVLLVSAVSHSRGRVGNGDVPSRLRARLEMVLDAVDASDAQRARAGSIVSDLTDLADRLAAAKKDLADRLIRALAGEEIDVETYATCRLETRKLTDEAFARFFDAVYDLSEILTPAQRRQLLRLVREHT